MSTAIANQMFLAYLGRPADTAWRSSTANLLNGNQPSAALQGAFYNAAVSEGVFSATDSNSTLVNKIFLQTFGFGASTFEQSAWSNLVTNGTITKETLAWTIFTSYLGATNVPDAYKLPAQSKLIAVDAYTNALLNDSAANLTLSQGGGAATLARSYTSGVTSQATAATAVSGVTASVASLTTAQTGSTFTLTTGTDAITGTSGNDAFNASITYVTAGGTTTIASATYNSGDQINGGAGTDIINLTVDGVANASAIAAPMVTGVETFNLRDVATGGITVDASALAGMTAFNSDRSTGDVTVTNLANGAAVGMIGNGSVANGTLRYAYATASADQVINISGGTSNSATANITATASTGVTKATINSTGAANKVDTIQLDSQGGNTVTSLTVNATSNLTATLTAGDFATTSALTVTGSASSVDLGSAGNFKTIDASGMSAGGLTIALGTNTTSFKGGAGNDVVTTAAITATAGAIDAGAGTADLLDVAAAADISTAAKGAYYTNFEILRNSTTSDLDVSRVSGITAIQLNHADAGAINMTAAQAAAITNRTDNSTNTFALKEATGTADVLAVNLQNTTASASADFLAATITGFETMNVVSSTGSSADISAVSFAAAENLTALNITGAKPIDVTTTNIVKAVAITASGLTYSGSAATDYALTIRGDLVKGSSVTGSGAIDKLTTTAAITGTTGDFVTYDAGAGNDAIFTTLAAINNTSGANGSVKIEGGAGTDTLTIVDLGATMVDANFQYLTGIEKIVFDHQGAINVTTGGFFITNFGTTGVTVTDGNAGANGITWQGSTFTGALTLTLTGAETTQNSTITTGSGVDKVTFTDTAITSAAIVINTGAGNDTISVTITDTNLSTGTVTITGGTGQDSITLAGMSGVAHADQDTIVIAAGDSTLAAADTITGFALGTAGAHSGNVIDFEGATAVSAQADAAAVAVTGYTAAQLTYTIASGLLTFAGTSASGLDVATMASLAATNILSTTKAVVFTYTSNGTTDSYVVEHATGGDSLVKLVGLTATGLGLSDHLAGHVDIS